MNVCLHSLVRNTRRFQGSHLYHPNFRRINSIVRSRIVRSGSLNPNKQFLTRTTFFLHLGLYSFKRGRNGYRSIGEDQTYISSKEKGWGRVALFVALLVGCFFTRRAQAEEKILKPKPLSNEEIVALAEELMSLKAFADLDRNCKEVAELTTFLETIGVFGNLNPKYCDPVGVALTTLKGTLVSKFRMTLGELARGFLEPGDNNTYNPSLRASLTLEQLLQKVCFKALVQICIDEKWEKFPKNRDLVERITNSSPSNTTLFLEMVAEGGIKQVQKLIDLKIDYRYRDNDGNNGLHIAAFEGHHDLIAILSHRFDINGRNSFKFQESPSRELTPLHIAIINSSC